MIMKNHPVARDVAAVAVSEGAANPSMVAAMTVLVGIAGAVYGPTINRALQRDGTDPEVYDTAAAMLSTWIADKSEDMR